MREKSGQIVMEMFLPVEADRFMLGKKGVSRAVDPAPGPVLTPVGSRAVAYRDKDIMQ